MSAQPPEIQPYQLQSLVTSVNSPDGPFSITAAGQPNEVRCAQALGQEMYVGCLNGELLRYALEEQGPTKSQSYILQSRQSLPQEKPIDEIVLLPSIARVLLLSAHHIFFYTLPSLDPVPQNMILPLRNVVAFAVDERHLARPPILTTNPANNGVDPVDFCVIKRSNVMMYKLRERLFFEKDIPLSQGLNVQLARRSGPFLCYADRENYNVLNLETSSTIPLLPISQAPDNSVVVKPSITIVGDGEFLILSWTGVSALGVFITGNGEPVRGTLEWPSYPEAVSLDYPHITALLSNQTIEVHNLEDQSLAQILSAPPDEPAPPMPGWPPEIERKRLISVFNPYMVPSSVTADKMRMTKVKLVRAN